MRYTVHLFALDGLAFARTLADESERILEQARALAAEGGRIKGRALKLGMKLAADICRGELPADCTADHFWALIWLADAELERIPLNSLVGFRGVGHVEEIGLWPLLGECRPPFPAPVGHDLCPAVGYLPADRIVPRALPALAALPAAEGYVLRARQQFGEVLETLAEDGLDLLTITVE